MSLSLSSFFHPPEGFLTIVGHDEGAEFAAQFDDDFAGFWRECPRADHMLYIAGWHDIDLRQLLGAGALIVQECADLLPENGSARAELAKVTRWASTDESSQSVEWKDEFNDHLPDYEYMVGAHEAQSAISQLVAVAKYGRNMGPQLPTVMSQIATWSVRSMVSRPWFADPRAHDLLNDFAEILRTNVDPELVQLARGPRFMPQSWSEATREWPTMFGDSR